MENAVIMPLLLIIGSSGQKHVIVNENRCMRKQKHTFINILLSNVLELGLILHDYAVTGKCSQEDR